MENTGTSSSRTDGLGRQIVCDARSPDGVWHVEVFGPNESCSFLYAYARNSEPGKWSFAVGREPADAARIAFHWDLPNGSWGIFIDGNCWAICCRRPSLRMRQLRIHSRSGPCSRPFTADEIRFICAKKRGQRQVMKGFVVEE